MQRHTENIYMKKKWIKGCLVFTAISLPSLKTVAQDKVEVELGADFVSSYIWRGQESGGVSIQPSLSVNYKGFSLGVWGSVGFDKKDDKEIDLILGYSHQGFSVSITDYWYAYDGQKNKFFEFDAHQTNHQFEAQIGYDFDFLAVNWYTIFAGADGVKPNGKRAYSSYIQLSAPFKLGDIDWITEVGATPWATDAYEDVSGFAMCDISLGASKELKITSTFSLPIFAKFTFNPASENAFATFGFSL